MAAESSFIMNISSVARLAPLVLIAVTVQAGGGGKSSCARSDATCWPTQHEIDDLVAALDPSLQRTLFWNGSVAVPIPAAMPSVKPFGSEASQPLFGFGLTSMAPLYEKGSDTSQCFASGEAAPGVPKETRGVCFAASRNNPREESPDFVAWALTTAHVEKCVQFAVRHHLCISVVGTGHDFMNRHSCRGGMLIRTTLLKEVVPDLSDTREGAAGSIRFGSGHTFHEAHHAAAQLDRYVSSGWASTVGIAGWSLGGGHGPFAPKAGLGVDNILEVEVVTANGIAVIANSTHNEDLWWAIRGGGGSTWGVVTAFTLRLHAIPLGGFQQYSLTWTGRFGGAKPICQAGQARFERVVEHYLDWAQKQGNAWGGLAFLTLTKSKDDCGGKWTVLLSYFYSGAVEEAAPQWDTLAGIGNTTSNSHTTFNNTWEFEQQSTAQGRAISQHTYTVVPWMPNSVPSVLVDREKVADGSMMASVKAFAAGFLSQPLPTKLIEVYQDITGNIDSPQPSAVSVSPGMRSGMLHVVASDLSDLRDLGDHAYFSESAYSQQGAWEDRYWGTANYARLLQVKRAWDPDNVFWCRHCIGA